MAKVDTDKIAAEIAKLQAQLNEALNEERTGALEDAKKLVAKYNFTAQELGLGVSAPKQTFKRAPAKAKYSLPDGSVTWTGRGRPPKLIANYLARNTHMSIEDLLIKQ